MKVAKIIGGHILEDPARCISASSAIALSGFRSSGMLISKYSPGQTVVDWDWDLKT